MFYEVKHLDKVIAVVEGKSFADIQDKLLLLVKHEHRGECSFHPGRDELAFATVQVGATPGSVNENLLVVRPTREGEHNREWVSFDIFEFHAR